MAGKNVDIYTPFVMVTGMILLVDNFKNVLLTTEVSYQKVTTI